MHDDPRDRPIRLKIYIDTSVLPANIAQHVGEAANLAAMRRLHAGQSSGRFSLIAARLAVRELSNTSNLDQRSKLNADYETFEKLPRDERLLGFNIISDRYGGFTGSPMISEVQDEQTRDALIEVGLASKDAEHISQALANACDFFLTRDVRTIIKPYRATIEARFPVKVRTPVEMIRELEKLGIPVP